MAYNGKIISGDCHIDIPWLPHDLFVSNAPPNLRDKMPRVKDTNEGKIWFSNGNKLGWVAGAGLGIREGGWDPYVPGTSTRLDRMEQHGFFSDGQRGLFHPTTPELRVKDQDIDGISGEVMYGVLGLAGGFLGLSEKNRENQPVVGRGGDGELPSADYGIDDPEVVDAVYDIYNEWAANFCKAYPDRLAALACISAHNPQKAVEQLKKAAQIGLRGAEMNVSSAAEPIYHKAWDPLWTVGSETGLPISFHTTGLIMRLPNKTEEQQDYIWTINGINICIFQLSGAEFLSSIILSGACDRFPNLKFVLGECGVGWIPYMLHRLDDEYDRQLFHLGLKLKPSEYWRRQGYSTFQHEFVTEELVKFVGEDNIIWGSDYPHPDCVWPDSRQVINENLGHLPERIIRKIVCENTASLYGFPVEEKVSTK